MLRNLRLCLLRTCCLSLVPAALMAAQAPGTGAIRGVVYDPAGHPLANVSVNVESESTHAIRSAVTDASGNFSFPLLVPGEYRGSVKAEGFAQNVGQSIDVVVSETTAVDFYLAL